MSQSEINEENEQDHGSLVFTPYQQKDLLALLQGSYILQSYSVNHITSKYDLSICIICTIPNMYRP